MNYHNNDNKDILAEYSRFLDSSGIHLTYSALSVYHDPAGGMSDKEKAFIARHLKSCALCSSRFLEVEEVEGAAEKGGIMKWPPGIRYSMAAVIVIGIGVTVLLTSLNRRTPLDSGDSPPVPSVDPARFEPNAIMENFVNRTLRSEEALRLESPGIGDTVKGVFEVRWSGNKGKVVTVMFVDNNNTEAWRDSSSGSGVVIQEPLESALYYLKVEMDGELVRVGRIIALR